MKNVQTNIKIVTEVERRKVELIVYAAYIMGFMAHANEQRTITSSDNWDEIHNLIEFITNADV